MSNSNLQEYIATRVKYFRKQKGISQEKLSEIAGLGTKAVQNIEVKKYDFKIQTISKILDALNISREEFFDLSISTKNQHLLDELILSIERLSITKQESILRSFIDILNNIE
ncbi:MULTISPECIES: helix-turn-helix domain-containing protein [unclassified Granulicatella]|uniref:helix-turn-helix domain-containing protein n=1 Tax=unclassified Granulicatella TaxID=2630493 RepID=UPI00107426DD|nr:MULTISPECIES: helix-turn-helix transcriptional regulator [unclassified Granulicatella]MBF0781100.1 helix-turn-helix domain-containing protein [Granulicatella sp. 19428wC4_WM01]TFU92126.1 helix-turn-helix domain-containing protein [Granulicatella sp. WM01]